jgi:hypothetical protein
LVFGEGYTDLAEYEKADSFLHMALAITDDPPESKVAVLCQMGSMSRFSCNYDDALDTLNQALEILSAEPGDRRNKSTKSWSKLTALVHAQIGDVLSEQGKRDVRQIDPFYTLDMSDPTNPVVAGELKILGFSNYLHPVSDDLILAIGQNSTETGTANGLQISLFDVSDFSNPVRVRNYVEDATWSSSEAQYDHKAFRYLPSSKLLILPLYIKSWRDAKDFFDGFVVYDVDENKDQFSKKFNVSPVEGCDARNNAKSMYCWSRAELTSRSLVFDGDVMTLKGHPILRHDLETEERIGYLNLDGERDRDAEYCSDWYYDSPMIMN